MPAWAATSVSEAAPGVPPWCGTVEGVVTASSMHDLEANEALPLGSRAKLCKGSAKFGVFSREFFNHLVMLRAC